MDGYIASPDGDISWLTDPSPRDHAQITSSRQAQTWETFYPSVDTLLMGRATYQKVLSFPQWPFEGKQVLVLSRSLDQQDDRVRVVSSIEEAQKVLAQVGAREVYLDGGQLIQEALRRGWVDELTVSRAPVLLGAGRPLFGQLEEPLALTLLASHVSEDGLVHSTYRVDY